MTGIKFQREAFADFFDDALPLLTKHKQEIDHWKDTPLRVERTFYRLREDAGTLRIYTARRQQLVGYAVFFVDVHPHNGERTALADVVYLEPEERRGRVGLNLLLFAEHQLRADGVEAIYHAVKIAHPTLGRILQHQGYEEVERIWAKRLK
jgi:GNAT superfamily N-acetyltransferase